MRTKKIVVSMLIIVGLLFNLNTIAQEKEKKTYQMAEITFMMPKIGMEKKFEDAVKMHNEKYHNEGPFKGSLDYILTGKQTGWYVWIMGPCMFSDLDNRPDSDAHRNDWDKTVSPTIAKYGSNEYWRYNEKLSQVSSDEENQKLEIIWFLEIKRGDYYRFKALIEKVKKAHEKKGESYRIYNNQFNENNGRDVAIVWSYSNWAQMDEDDGGIKKTFEEIYGEGSWDNFIDEWEDVVVARTTQLWKIGI